MGFSIVILAAGKGKRMQSRLLKVLHPLAGKPLLGHIVDTSLSLEPQQVIIVTGDDATMHQQALPQSGLSWVNQSEPKGTAHAVQQALPSIDNNHRVLILAGDVPLISAQTLQKLYEQTPQDAIGVLVTTVEDPTGFGRIIRDDQNQMTAIVEQRDTTSEQAAIQEINTGIILAPATVLKSLLSKVKANNAQQEFYLTDIIALAIAENTAVTTVNTNDAVEVQGVNSRAQLVTLERHYQRRQADKLLSAGVTVCDPDRFDLRGELSVGTDITIDINVILEGEVHIGNACIIEANCILRNVTLGDHVHVKANSVIENARIDDHCEVGPFARLRPETHLKAHAKIGNFVEVKKSVIGDHSKVNHLSYIGDSLIGQRVNIGAGTITCNYDGANKHQTIIEDNVFVGSDTQLVAPVLLGQGTTIAAGTTVTKNTPPEVLCLSRVEQKIIKGWKRPKKSGE